MLESNKILIVYMLSLVTDINQAPFGLSLFFQKGGEVKKVARETWFLLLSMFCFFFYPVSYTDIPKTITFSMLPETKFSSISECR